MNTRKSLTFFVIFVLVTVAYLVIEKPFKDPYGKDTSAITKLFKGLKPDQVSKIEIKQGDKDKFILVKKDDEWKVENYDNFPANKDEVEDIIKSAIEFDTANLSSTNPAHHQTFEVDNKKGIETKMMDSSGAVLAHFFVGKNGPTFTDTYVRAEGSEKVYLEKGYLKGKFDKSRYKWRDRDILNLEKADIAEITLHDESKTAVDKNIVLSKTMEGDKEKWFIQEPEKILVKQSEIGQILSSLSAFKADDFATAKKANEVGIETPTRWIAIKMKDGMNYTLQIGSKDKSQLYVAKAGSPYIYKVSEYKITNLLKTSTQLKEKEKPKTKEEETKGAKDKPLEKKTSKKK